MWDFGTPGRDCLLILDQTQRNLQPSMPKWIHLSSPVDAVLPRRVHCREQGNARIEAALSGLWAGGRQPFRYARERHAPANPEAEGHPIAAWINCASLRASFGDRVNRA